MSDNNGKKKGENDKRIDFIKTAFPFVIIGICLAVMAVAHHSRKSKGEKANYLTEGMCFGMCLGVTVSSVCSYNIGLGISLGILIGETVGYLIKKKES